MGMLDHERILKVRKLFFFAENGGASLINSVTSVFSYCAARGGVFHAD